uniref:Putative secreted peptide n=1 Tax=Anopheles braziliensis TaxID=58242 RepID=A0A2M3ZSQ2_9DIPT
MVRRTGVIVSIVASAVHSSTIWIRRSTGSTVMVAAGCSVSPIIRILAHHCPWVVACAMKTGTSLIVVTPWTWVRLRVSIIRLVVLGRWIRRHRTFLFDAVPINSIRRVACFELGIGRW